jgi:sec-independent protein translocase protein TatC
MENDSQQPLISHLIELRDRLLRGIVAVLVISAALMPFSNDLYHLLADPLLQQLPESSTMIATEVASPFLTPFKLTLSLAILLSVPVLLYQLWAFVAPGLYENERKMVLPLLVASTLLFFLGIVFAYFVVFPLIFQFLAHAAPEGVTVMTDISSYLDFVLKLFFAFGIAFEVPIATLLLIWTGVSSIESLTEKRPYIIVGAFVIGMLLTPPDVISQTLLAVPVWLLFESGLLCARFLPKKTEAD